MTDDKELIARLRMVTGFIRFETGDRIAASACLSEEAADRIEQLVATNEALVKERDEAWKRAAHSEKMWGEALVKSAEIENLKR
jgi:hypothetical protein